MAVVTGKVTSTCSRMDRFGYTDALHAVYASSAVLGGSAAACQRCFHSSNSVTKMHTDQSIGYAAAYPAYPLNPPLIDYSEAMLT